MNTTSDLEWATSQLSTAVSTAQIGRTFWRDEQQDICQKLNHMLLVVNSKRMGYGQRCYNTYDLQWTVTTLASLISPTQLKLRFWQESDIPTLTRLQQIISELQPAQAIPAQSPNVQIP